MPNHIPEPAQYLLDEADADRFWGRVTFDGPTEHEADPLATATGNCWNYRGALTEAGYGRFKLFGAWRAAHRIAYRDFGNKLTDTEVLDHLCRNHACVRPSHLEAVAHAVNVRRGIVGNRTHCKNGHEYTDENTKMTTRDGGPVRVCRTCRHEWSRQAQQRKANGHN